MMFMVTLIALLIERFFDWSYLRQGNGFIAFQQYVAKKLPGSSPYVLLALTILPVLVAVVLVEVAIDGWLYGFAKLVYELALLVYCLGPQNLWADTFGHLNAKAYGGKGARDEASTPLVGQGNSRSQPMQRHFLEHIFLEANRRLFAVIFWYSVLGAFGMVLYRLVSLSASQAFGQSPQTTTEAQRIGSILDWLPVRIFAFFFALGGHFVQVFTIWQGAEFVGLASNEALLVGSGVAALGMEMGHVPEDGSAEKSAISLLDRALVMWVVVLAILTLIC